MTEIVEEQFKRLTILWQEETAGLSNPSTITTNHNYQAIIRLGKCVVPLIIADLRDYGGFWYPALRTLTGVNPVPRESAGRPSLMRQAWLDWWAEQV